MILTCISAGFFGTMLPLGSLIIRSLIVWCITLILFRRLFISPKFGILSSTLTILYSFIRSRLILSLLYRLTYVCIDRLIILCYLILLTLKVILIILYLIHILWCFITFNWLKNSIKYVPMRHKIIKNRLFISA